MNMVYVNETVHFSQEEDHRAVAEAYEAAAAFQGMGLRNTPFLALVIATAEEMRPSPRN